MSAVGGCTSAAPSLAFRHPVPFEVIASTPDAVDSIRIDSVWSASEKLEPGRTCWIHGSYSLGSSAGTIALESLPGESVFGDVVVRDAIPDREGRRFVRQGAGTVDFLVVVDEVGLYRLVLSRAAAEIWRGEMHVVVRVHVDHVPPSPVDLLKRVGER
jgi:hypothetical protein